MSVPPALVQVAVKGSMLALSPSARWVVHGTHGSFVKYGLDTQEKLLKKSAIPPTPTLAGGDHSDEEWGVDEVNGQLRTLSAESGKPCTESVENVTGRYHQFYSNVARAIRWGLARVCRYGQE